MMSIEDDASDYQEVANFEGTFEEAVTKCVVPVPSVMSFNQWIAWRKGDGMRPTRAHGCARTTKPSEESAIWQRAMKRHYGDDWRQVLDETQLAIAIQDEVDQKDQELDAPAGFGLDASLL